MIADAAGKIIEATCSITLQRAIKRTNFEIADFDLLYLVYKHAPDFETKLELLRLIETKTDDAVVRETAAKCIAYEQVNLEQFVSPEKDCVYEIAIKNEPAAYGERYLAKTIDTALRTIRNWCEFYEDVLTEQSRFTVTKRMFTDGMTAENFNEGWRGEATYKGVSVQTAERIVASRQDDYVLVDVCHQDVREATALSGGACDDDTLCCDCECRPCILRHAPKLPLFLKNLDLVCSSDCAGMRRYGVFCGYSETDDTDDCAYLVHVYENALCEKTLKTKELFFERISNLHEHVEFPRLDIARTEDVPPDIMKTYKTFKKLYRRFNGE
jgi:hypothetical protein